MRLCRHGAERARCEIIRALLCTADACGVALQAGIEGVIAVQLRLKLLYRGSIAAELRNDGIQNLRIVFNCQRGDIKPCGRKLCICIASIELKICSAPLLRLALPESICASPAAKRIRTAAKTFRALSCALRTCLKLGCTFGKCINARCKFVRFFKKGA